MWNIYARKQAVLDKLHKYRFGEVVNNQIKKGLLLSHQWKNA